MKAYFVLIILAVALWWEYNHRLQKGKGNGRTRNGQRNAPGVTSTKGGGVRQATQFSTTGSASPGSGVLPVQPALATTWGVTGGYGIGYTGPSYVPNHGAK